MSIFLVALNIKIFVGFNTSFWFLQSMQHIILAVLLPSMTKQPSKYQICGEGVLGFSEKQFFFLIILIFKLDSHHKMLLSYTY